MFNMKRILFIKETKYCEIKTDEYMWTAVYRAITFYLGACDDIIGSDSDIFLLL